MLSHGLFLNSNKLLGAAGLVEGLLLIYKLGRDCELMGGGVSFHGSFNGYLSPDSSTLPRCTVGLLYVSFHAIHISSILIYLYL